MKKFIAILILISTLTLSSCEYIPSLFGKYQDVKPEGETPQNTEISDEKEKEYWGTKTLHSYDELMNALSIVRQYHKPKHQYTVTSMGENYTVMYNFAVPQAWISYPIDYETYFTTVSDGSFMTFIFFENQPCPGHELNSRCSASRMYVNRGEEDRAELLDYKYNHASVCLLEKASPVEITDISELSYEGYDMGDYFSYDVTYCGEWIIELQSCVELDKAFFNAFFRSLIVV